MIARLAVLCCVALVLPRPAAVARAQTRLLVISGLGGEPAYSESFRRWATTLSDAARTRYGLPDSHVVILTEDGKGSHVSGASTKANIERALARFSPRSGTPEKLVVVLFGHGSGTGEDSKISIPGPDLSAADFARLLAPWRSRTMAFVDLTSASGDFLPVLAAPNHIVITATKSSFERNASVFAGYFVEAFTSKGADSDKDGRVSLLEAFRYAAAETKRYYDQDAKLQTEHALLDDVGDKHGAVDPDGRTAEGLLASRVFLDASPYASQDGVADPRLAELYRAKAALEEQLAAVRQRKTSMSASAYDDSLEDVLVKIALNAREIRKMEGR